MILEMFCLRHTISIDNSTTFFKVQWLLYIPPGLTLALVCGRSLAWIAGSNSARGTCMFVFCESCVLSGSFCEGPITRPEESHRV